ncbi:transporter [uncultured Shimia sp.]|uniref:transporter n=1 Tax=uncultured Shimia sp. TaxID=573152 RepID=UPI002634221B|nr:transporter [uncultured Shimia sp.]
MRFETIFFGVGQMELGMKTLIRNLILSLPFFFTCQNALADDAELAKQLSNPLASLISVPMQFNYDTGFGTPDGERLTLNIQPVIPFSLTPELNLITRTIIPYKWQSDVAGSPGSDSGLGDTSMSFWFSPAHTANGSTWGVGPILSLPTSSDPDFGLGEWGGGITGVYLVQPGPWTIGALGNHLWSFESDNLNSTYIQPFVAYGTPNHWTYTVNSEATYDWNTKQWTLPVNFMVSKLVSFGKQKVSLQGGVRYYFDSAANGPEGWGFRFAATFVFPKK